MARRGFTLAEATLALVLLGIAAAGVLLPFSGGAAAQAEGVRRTLGAMLANDLVERIVNTPFDDIVTKYGNHVESEGEIEDGSGTPYTDSMYAGFSREAKCELVDVPPQSGDAEPNFILATVRVAYRGRDVATINRLIGE
jgi:prepilin-type N-terminal cleavage/methylation domain-containing protein